jgi:hypothetical protein
VLDQRAHARPVVHVDASGEHRGRVEDAYYLLVDVELELLGGRVADPYRSRALIARKSVEFDLLEKALALGPVHDL